MAKYPTSQEQYKIIFENSAAAIMLTDDQQKIISWNRFTEDMLGMGEDDLYQRAVASLYPKDEWERLQLLKVSDKGKQDHFETKMIKKNGQTIDVDVSITVIKDETGKVTGSVGVVRDISERKVIQRELLDAHRMKGDFLAMVSHELRTPLTAIKGSIGIVLDGSTGDVNEEQKDFLTTAQRNTDRLEILINNVLDYQRLEAGAIEFKLVPDDVNTIVDLAKAEMDLLASKKNLSIRVEKTADLPRVMIDRERFKRAIRNLVDNAIKFTEQGEIVLSTGLELKQVSISVKDTGIGIKPEDRSTIFDRFSQVSAGHGRQTGSLGLGLVTARKIVSAHHGDIWIQSEFGKGSTFTILLPALES